MHEKNLIESKEDRKKFSRRIKRLQNLLNTECHFLYNITSESLSSKEKVNNFYNSVIDFKAKLNDKHFLYVSSASWIKGLREGLLLVIDCTEKKLKVQRDSWLDLLFSEGKGK
mgnify:CR=1 FL=1